ncbi:glycosidase [Dactylosporangium darangshiense]|uniref:Glycosidase n=1 Tax=Dactylosporangium darangshiense TaxID=579108 RepID=A0ABP8CV76_9ACTN
MHFDAELFHREATNPLLTAGDWPYPINSVFNPGACLHNGDTVLVCRVEDRRGISHLTVARSKDGRTNWVVDGKPLIADDPTDAHSCWGVEDPRVTYVQELGAYVIAYTAYGPGGPCVGLARTEDFLTVESLGVVMPPEDKNASLLPRMIDGHYVLFHRPVSVLSARADVWLSKSTDLRSWTTPDPVMQARSGPWWDATRIGMGPPPIETPHGWLAVYHGVKAMVATSIYRVGLVMLDLDDPTKVIRRTPSWVLGPDTDYERVGDVPNVVFPSGLVLDETTDELRLYYGAADLTVGMASARFSEVVDYLISLPAEDE